jgi:hypothetical protein
VLQSSYTRLQVCGLPSEAPFYESEDSAFKSD